MEAVYKNLAKMFDPMPSGANQVAFGMVCHHWDALLKKT